MNQTLYVALHVKVSIGYPHIVYKPEGFVPIAETKTIRIEKQKSTTTTKIYDQDLTQVITGHTQIEQIGQIKTTDERKTTRERW